MKAVLLNLLGELPYLLVLTACYIIMDRAMFESKLSGLIRKGLAARLRRMRNRKSGFMPLQPVKQEKVLTTVAYDEGLAGHTGEVSPKPQNKEGDNGIFTQEDGQSNDTAKQDAVVSAEEYDRVFADSRLEIVPTDDDDEQWVQPVSAAEIDTGPGYDYPDDYDDEEYDELETAFAFVRGREQTKKERDLAARIIHNLEGTPMLEELEQTRDMIQEKIKAAVEETFADVYRTESPVEGFDMGSFS